MCALSFYAWQGMDGAGKDWRALDLSPAEHLERFNLFAERTHITARYQAHPLDGVVRPDLIKFMLAAAQLGALASRSGSAHTILITLATDGMAITPKLEVLPQLLQLVGAEGGPKSVADLHKPHAEDSLAHLYTSVVECHALTLATRDGSQFEMPIAAFGESNRGGASAVAGRHAQLMSQLTACLSCLITAEVTGAPVKCEEGCPWEECSDETCARCTKAGVPPQASILERGCKACVRRQYQAALAAEALGATSAAPPPPTTKGTKAAPLKTEQEARMLADELVCAAGLSTACCLRVHPLALASDQEAKEAALMRSLDADATASLADPGMGEYKALTFPFPDGVHLLKLCRSGLHWWWCVLDGHLFSMRLLFPLRRSADEKLRVGVSKAVRTAALRNRDRMSFETVLELLSFDLADALPPQAPVVVTLFPEVWTKLVRDCPPGAVGCVADVSPVAARNLLFFSDPERRQIRMVQLHCPVRVSLVAGGGRDTDGRDRSRDDPCFGPAATFSQPWGLCTTKVRVSADASTIPTFLFVVDASGGGQMLSAIDVSPLLNESMRVYQGDEQEPGFEEQYEGTTTDATSRKHNRLAHVSNVSIAVEAGTAQPTQPTGICNATAGRRNLEWPSALQLLITDAACAVVYSAAVSGADDLSQQHRRPTFRAVLSLHCSLPSGFQPIAVSCSRTVRVAVVGCARSGRVLAFDADNGQHLHSCCVPEVSSVHGIALRDDGALQLACWPGSIVGGQLSRDPTTGSCTITALDPCIADGHRHMEDCGTCHDDLARLATTARPRAIVWMGKSAVFADGIKNIRLLTDVAPLKRVFAGLAPFAAAIGHLPGAAPLTWAEATDTLRALVSLFQQWEREACERTGRGSAKGLNGPDGILSAQCRNGFRMFERSAKGALAWAKSSAGVDLEAAGVSWSRLLELTAERFFHWMRAGAEGSSAMPTYGEYCSKRARVIDIRLERRFMGHRVPMFTGSDNYYPELKERAADVEALLTKLAEQLDLPSVQAREVGELSSAERRAQLGELREWQQALSGARTRQNGPRARTADHAGALPAERQLTRPPAEHGERSELLAHMLGPDTAGNAAIPTTSPIVRCLYRSGTVVAFKSGRCDPRMDAFGVDGIWLGLLDGDVHVHWPPPQDATRAYVHNDVRVVWLTLLCGESLRFEREFVVPTLELCQAIVGPVEMEDISAPYHKLGTYFSLPDDEYLRLKHLGEDLQQDEWAAAEVRAERSRLEAEATAEAMQFQRQDVERLEGKRPATKVARRN